MSRPVLAVCTLALLVALVGCSGGEGGDEVLSGQSSRPSASSSGSPSAPSSTTPTTPTTPPAPTGGAASPGTAPLEPFPATTGADVQEASGALLTVVDVRVARQEGYDRVVFELRGKGAGQPGWRVAYTGAPEQDGSGTPVVVKGATTLAVVIDGVGYPFDTGQEQETGKPALPSDLQVVQDVVLGAAYEGQYQAFIGTTGEAPFRVFRLSDPARVVVDVRHR